MTKDNIALILNKLQKLEDALVVTKMTNLAVMVDWVDFTNKADWAECLN